jgi:hypothetical protein
MAGSDSNLEESVTFSTTSPSIPKFLFFASIGILYWYLMVFASAAASNGIYVPDFIPLVPGWPPSDADLAPVLEDSNHFFYLSELLKNADAPYVNPARLAVFNIVEAWIFGLLPLLWRDPKRLPRPVLLLGWSILGINLTNAFLAPYLATSELIAPTTATEVANAASHGKNRIVSAIFGLIVWMVVTNALYQSVVVANAHDWYNFFQLAQTDRTYLAFCVDSILLAVFQPLIFARIREGKERNVFHYVPIFGLIAWLLLEEEKDGP